MGVREKFFQTESIYFITFTIFKWQRVFVSKKYYDLFYKWFDYQKANYRNKIHGFVIMPNHFHGLIFISKKSPPISKLIQNAKRFLAYGIVKYLKEDEREDILNLFSAHSDKRKNAKHKVFTDRYDSKIMETEKMFLEKLNYIHLNPIKEPWLLAKSPEDYPYSSASNYIRDRGFYDVDVIY